MSFLDEIKKEYQEASILTDDIKDRIKTKIRQAAKEGGECATISINTDSEALTESAMLYVREELGLNPYNYIMSGCFNVNGWS